MAENQDFHNKSGMYLFLGSMVFVTVFFIYMVTLNKGVDLGEKIEVPPSSDAPIYNLSAEKEPWVSTPEIVKAGGKLFKQNCAVCHGEKGDLVGGVPNARNFVEGKWTHGDGIIGHFKTLQTGVPGTAMVSFKAQLKPFERWAILNFIETLTTNKSKDKPEDVANFAKTAE